jgi:Fic-DOC domain mobile mystery protein B
VSKFFFKDRDGRTPLPENFKKDLIPKHVKFGGELDEYEEANISDGLVWLSDCSRDCCDWMFWETLHRKLFGKVWRWAGKFRLIELMNDEFNHPGTIKENIKKLEGDLGYWLENKSFEDHEIVARFHERFLTIHPFTNGNGRTCRILTEYICEQKGITVPTWGASLKTDAKVHRDTYIASVVRARRKGDFQSLIEFLYD